MKQPTSLHLPSFLCALICRQELLENAAIAVAADTSKPVSELGPDDWEILPLEDVNEE
jgi:hypothetical protein